MQLLKPASKSPSSFGKRYEKGAVRQIGSSISIHMTVTFYEATKERHSVRAASRLSLNVLRFESDLCELNRL